MVECIVMKHKANIYSRLRLFIAILICFVSFSGKVEALTGATLLPPNNLGLLSYWSFDEGDGTKATDASGNENTGTLTNMEASDWVVGKKGEALEFDGSNEYVDMGSAISSISGNTSFTMCAWINTNSVSAAQAVVATGNPDVALNAAALFLNVNGNGSLSLEFAGGNTAASANNLISAGQWYHICGTKTAGAINTTSTLYIDGQPVSLSTASSNTPSIATTDASIGQFVASGYYFNGKIDDVRVYNRALSASEIVSLYNVKTGQLATSRNSYITNGLLLLYSFDGVDVLSETAYDRSGQGNNATTEGFSTTTTPIGGMIGQGFYFLAPNTKVTSASDVAIQDDGARTISAWARLDEGATDAVLVALGVAGSNTLFAPECLSGNWQINGFGGGNDFDTTVACDSDWHHHVITYDGTTAKYYLDNVQIGGDFTHTFATTLAPVIVGARNDDGLARWSGAIDDVRIYNRVLTSAEIARLYRIGSPTLIK